MNFETLWGNAAQNVADGIARNAFQTNAWVKAVAAARRRRHSFVAVRVVGGAHSGACLFGGIHRRFGIQVFESMPMGGYGGWCFEGALDADQESSLSRAWLARSPWWVVGLTGVPGRECSLPSAKALAWMPSRWRGRLEERSLTTHILSLAGDDGALLARAQPKARNHLRRVDRSSYAIEIGGPDAFVEFCRLFRAGSVGWHQPAKELMPDEFFRRLLDGGIADIWRATKDGQCTAAALFLKGRTEIFYQASGTLRAQGEVSATDALIWTAMRYYRDRGYQTLNLGASEGLESVRFFKEKLGGVPTSYRQVTFVLPKFSTAAAQTVAPCQ